MKLFRCPLPVLSMLATTWSLVATAPSPVWAQQKPAQEQPATARPADKKLLRSKDYLLKEEGSSKYEQMARQKRGEAIQKLDEILKSGNIEGDQKPELLMRLAELYWETAKDTYLVEMAEFDKRYGEWVESKDKNKGPEPKPDLTKSQQHNAQAITLYREILEKHPGYPRMDQVFFNIGYNLMDLGKKTEALEFYERLVKAYPQSDFVPDTYLALGEYWFDNNNALKALPNYKKASTYTDAKIQVFALYKLGWCYYNVGEYARAIDSMKEVIAKSAPNPGETGKLSLKEEALNDLVLFYSELGDMDAAYKYFSQFNDKKYFKAMLKRLAGVYYEQGKNETAITVYRRLISEDPNAKDAPSFQGEVIACFFKWGKKEETIAEIDRLAAVYGPDSAWAKANASNAEALKDANELIEKNLRSVAVDYHKEARKTGSKKTYELAQGSYQKYLGMFPSNKHSYDIRYAYAEVLYELKRYEEAADQYEKVVQIDPKGQYFQAAASSLIFAIDKVLGIDSGPDSAKKPTATATAAQPAEKKEDTDTKPVALTPWEERKVKACDLFAKSLPEHKDAASIQYEAGLLLYEKNQFDQSTPRFLHVIERWSKSDVAEVAANLVLDSYNQLQDWDKIEGYSRAFLKNPNFGPEFQKELKGILEKSAYKKIEGIEKKGQDQATADAFLAYATEFQSSSLAERGLFNSAYYYYKAGDVRKSITVREKLLASYPKSEFTGQNLDALAKAYESIADYRKAADYYEQLAAWDKGRTFAGTADALFNSGLFRASHGDWQKAIANYTTYVTAYPDKENTSAIMLEIGRIYEANNKQLEALNHYKAFFSNPANAGKIDAVFEARLRYGKILRSQGKNDLANASFQESAALFDRLSKSGAKMEIAPLYVAEMRFYLIEPMYKKYEAIKLELPKKQAKGAPKTAAKPGNPLTEKLKLKDQLIAAYTSVLELKQGEWGLAALFQIAETHRELADALLNSPTPPQLTPAQAEIYRAKLQDTAFPLVDSAADYFTRTLTRSYELGLYNEFTARAASRLAQLRPKEYPAQAESLKSPDYISKVGGSEALEKSPEKAVEQQRELLIKDPKNIVAYRNLAGIYFDQGNYKLSQLLSANALKLNPNDAGAHNNLGVTLLKLGLERAAILEFKRAVEIDASHREANLNLGYIALKSGDYQLARTSFDNVLKSDARSTDAQLGLAVALRGGQEMDGALAAYQKVLSQDPNNYMALYNLGIVHEKYLQDFDKALQYFDRCVTLAQTPQVRTALQVKLEEVRKEKETFLENKRKEEERLAREKAEAERIAREQAEKKKAEDEAKASLAALISETEKRLNEGKGKLPKQKVEPVQMAIEQSKTIIEAGDLDMLKEAYTYLQSAARELGN